VPQEEAAGGFFDSDNDDIFARGDLHLSGYRHCARNSERLTLRFYSGCPQRSADRDKTTEKKVIEWLIERRGQGAPQGSFEGQGRCIWTREIRPDQAF